MRVEAPQPSYPKPGARAVATIVGAALLALALLALIAFYIYTQRQQYQTMQQVTSIIEEKLNAPLLAQAVHATYTVTSTGDLVVNITSYAPRTILVTSLLVVWDDNTTTTLDRWNTTPTNVVITLTHPNGQTEQLDKLPAPLAPGDTLTITLEGYAATRTPRTVTITISASPVVAVVPATPPTPTAANITITPQFFKLYQTLERNYYQWSQLYAGPINATYLVQLLANVTDASTGQPEVYSEADGNYAVIQAEASWLITSVYSAGNKVYSYDFEAGWDNWTVYGTSTYWALANVGQPYNQVLEYTQTRVDRATNSWESIAYYNESLFAQYSMLCALGYISPQSGTGDADFVIWDGQENVVLTVSIEPPSSAFLLYVYTSTSGWNGPLAGSTNSAITTGVWYAVSVCLNKTTGLINASLWDVDTGVRLASFSYDLTQVLTQSEIDSLAYLGYGSYAEQSYYDYFLVSLQNATEMVFNVTVEGYPNFNGTLVIIDASGNTYSVPIVVGRAVVHLFADYPGPLPYIPVSEIRVENDTLGVNATYYLNGVLYFGETYYLTVEPRYTADVYVTVQLNTTLPIVDFAVQGYFTADSAGSWAVGLLNWTSGSYVRLSSGLFTANVPVDFRTSWISYPSSFVDSSGYVRIWLHLESDSAFSANVDMLNVVYRYSVPFNGYGLLVGSGGDSWVDFYAYNESTGRFEYQFSIDIHSTFDGSTAFWFNPSDGYLYFVNGTGVYRVKVEPGAAPELVTSQCASEGSNTALAVLGGGVLLVVEGGDTDTYCLVNLATGSVSVGGLSQATGLQITLSPDRVATSWAAYGDSFWLLAYSIDNHATVLLKYNSTLNSWAVLAMLPESYSVGLAYNPADSNVYVMFEEGGLYRVSSDGTVLRIANPGLVPAGLGDTMSYFEPLGIVYLDAHGTGNLYLGGY